ncbi:MAG: DUF1573 domain-containing protein [Saprospiraceae bacterium]|nr:DUF1573 domain-containing protein [Saprospiraceae bacterium]
MFLFVCFQLIFQPFLIQVDHQGKPVVEWLISKEYDFGEIEREQPVSVVFEFKNISDTPIMVETVRTTCGCTAASWTETTVQPGQKGEIRVEYDAYQSGDFRKKIKVFFDKQKKPEILKISGFVK